MKSALLIIGVLLVVGLAAWPLMEKAPSPAHTAAATLGATPLLGIEVPPVEVQLKGEKAPRLVLGLTLECDGPDAAQVQDAHVVQRIRDELLRILAGLTPEEAGETPERRFALKRLLAARLGTAAFGERHVHIRRVHFTKLLFANSG